MVNMPAWDHSHYITFYFCCLDQEVLSLPKKHRRLGTPILEIQVDQKNVPPFPGRDEKFSRKTE